MIGNLVFWFSVAVFAWLIFRDVRSRSGLSPAIWIPTLWAGVLLSRPLSLWLNWGGGTNSLEGSPLDRLFYFGSILGSMAILSRRHVLWSQLLVRNWPLLLFYGYYLLSVTWAPEPFVSFKRWFKEVGNIFVALVILTEANPLQAFRAVFVRCGIVLIPLSIVYLRYFPETGRRYLRGGQMEAIGVTMQKNSLGILIVVCCLVVIWDWLERRSDAKAQGKRLQWIDHVMPLTLLGMGAYLLRLCDSKTSILCFLIGSMMLGASRLSWFRQRASQIGFLTLAGFAGFFLLDWMFGIKGAVLRMLGRDATLTGRTEVWEFLLSLKTDPVFGTGFCSFWSDKRYLSQLPDWIGYSAHNGYLEAYIDGGYFALFFLGILLLVTGTRIYSHLRKSDNYSLIRFAFFTAMVIGCVSESHFGRMSPLSFVFLLAVIGYAPTFATYRAQQKAAGQAASLRPRAGMSGA
jgi:exopolysaccharide production protein ExoQ